MRCRDFVSLLSFVWLGALACSNPHVSSPRSTPAPATTSNQTSPANPTDAGLHVNVDGGASEDDLALVFTTQLQGYVEPCGCTADPLGGVARFASAMTDLRNAYGERMLVVDAGNMLFEHLDDNRPADACQAGARTELLLRSLANAGLAVTHPGALDDVRGAAFREQALAGAGIRALHNEQLSLQRGKHQIDIAAYQHTSLIDLQQRLPTWRMPGAHAPLRVLLFAGNQAQAVQVAAGLYADVIIVRDTREEPAPAHTDKTTGAIVVSGGKQGQHAQWLELRRRAADVLVLDDRQQKRDDRNKLLTTRITTLQQQLLDVRDDNERRAFLQQRLAAAEQERITLAEPLMPMTGPRALLRQVPLQRGLAEDSAAAAALLQYRNSVPTLVAQCEADIVCEPPAPEQATFVGAATCGACHADALAFWQNQVVVLPTTDLQGRKGTRAVGHVKAWETLVHDGKDKDRSCVGCHSVGFNQPGGACKTSQIVERGLAGVQCESCHGPGSAHVAASNDDERRAAIVGRPTEAQCRTCHVPPHIPTVESFVWSERRALVIGPGHGEASAP
jgi:hypothetical protein